MIEKQELHCHECNQYVQFEIDLSINGNHVLQCPNCGHEHCRVVKDGIITEDRWDQRNNNIQVSQNVCTSSTTSTYNTYSMVSTGSYYLYGSWNQTVTAR